MRVGIVGAGALGSLVGGLLSHAGVDVVLLRRDEEHIEHVKANVLRRPITAFLTPVSSATPAMSRGTNASMVIGCFACSS